MLNAGDNVPVLSVSPLKSALEDAARVTVTVYVRVLPSPDVTITVIVLSPTFNAIAWACPLATAAPFTVTVAEASAVVGVTFILATSLPTLAV
ncbi:hypothetical protein D3C76_1545980 [compost metagenome]